MSDLVGNPEDRFSRVEAHTIIHYKKLYNMVHLLALNVLLLPKDLTIIFIIIEPSHEKANNLGFQLSPTQTGLCSPRKNLEAGNFGYK